MGVLQKDAREPRWTITQGPRGQQCPRNPGELILWKYGHGLRGLVVAQHRRPLGKLATHRRHLLPQAIVTMTVIRTFLRDEGFEHRLEGLFVQRV